MLFNLCLLFMVLMSIFMTNFQFIFMFIFISMFMIMNISYHTEEFSFCFNSLFIYSDKLSMNLQLLTLFLMIFIMVHMYNCISIFFLNLVLLMFLILFVCFFTNNLLLFYIFFEFSLIPLFLIIMLKGSSLERFKANLYLMMYTLFGSLMFLMVLYFTKNTEINFFLMSLIFLKKSMNIMYLMMILIFLIKTPMYGVHFWLSKAHVEAPVEGSMLLAGILLKLGGFGLFRVLMYLNYSVMKMFMNLLVFISLFGSVLVSMICMRQIDIKLLIAYSSVSHMGLMMSGMMTLTKMGWSGAMGMMIAHGFCSSGLFYMSNMIYLRCSTRNLLIYKGFFSFYTMFIFYWLVFSVCNMGTPPFINFFCELMLIMSVMNKSLINILLIIFYLFLVVYYNLLMFLSSGHGFSMYFYNMKKENFTEMMVITLNFMFLFIFLLKMNVFIIMM